MRVPGIFGLSKTAYVSWKGTFEKVFCQAGDATELHQDHVGCGSEIGCHLFAAADSMQKKRKEQTHHILIYLRSQKHGITFLAASQQLPTCPNCCLLYLHLNLLTFFNYRLYFHEQHVYICVYVIQLLTMCTYYSATNNLYMLISY